MTYYSLGSTTGKCNIMGYWHTGNTALEQPSTSIKDIDTAICTDKCTLGVCGWNSNSINNRTNHFRSTPLVDFGASDALLSANDYLYYKDLLMLPAVGGGVVPIYNIPELTAASATNPSVYLTLSRTTIANIFLGNSYDGSVFT